MREPHSIWIWINALGMSLGNHSSAISDTGVTGDVLRLIEGFRICTILNEAAHVPRIRGIRLTAKSAFSNGRRVNRASHLHKSRSISPLLRKQQQNVLIAREIEFLPLALSRAL